MPPFGWLEVVEIRDDMGNDRKMSPHLNVVGMVVADMAASLAFYRLLGLDIPADAAAQPHVEAKLPGGLILAWDTQAVIGSFDASWSPPTGGPRMSLAFECASPDDVDHTYGQLVAAGAHAHLPPWDAVWRQRYAIVHDPDGNSVDLYASL